MYLCVPCHCDACFKSSALRMGVKTLHNTTDESLFGKYMVVDFDKPESVCKYTKFPSSFRVEWQTVLKWC